MTPRLIGGFIHSRLPFCFLLYTFFLLHNSISSASFLLICFMFLSLGTVIRNYMHVERTGKTCTVEPLNP